MFSSRTNWNTAPNRLSELLQEKRKRGESIIDLTEMNPTKCGFSYPTSELLQAAADPSIFSYEPDPRGLLSARKAIANYYAQQSFPVSPEQLFLTASTSEAYSYLFKLLCNPGDEVLVPQPSYPLFDYLCQLENVVHRMYRLVYRGEWQIDFESIQSQCSSRTKAIILVHPNNPTGTYVKQFDYNRILSLASDHHCALIADEVFGPYDIIPDQNRARILSSQTSVPVFSLNGISKLLGLPQLKLSWIAVLGAGDVLPEIMNRLEIITDTYLSVNTISQIALPCLLQHSSEMIAQIRSRIQTNYSIVKNKIENSNISLFHVEGGWAALLQFPQSCSDLEWSIRILQQNNILTHPGHFFDMTQQSCIMISLLPESRIFEDALTRVIHSTKEISASS